MDQGPLDMDFDDDYEAPVVSVIPKAGRLLQRRTELYSLLLMFLLRVHPATRLAA